MAVRIRLSRYGRLHRPFFRIIAIDGRAPREGEANEILGTYDPLKKEKNIEVDIERVAAWVAKGALISLPLVRLLKHHGYTVPVTSHAAKIKRAASKAPAKKGTVWTKPTRRARLKHAAAKKAVWKAKLAEQAAAKAAEKAAAAPAPAAEAPKA